MCAVFPVTDRDNNRNYLVQLYPLLGDKPLEITVGLTLRYSSNGALRK